MTGTPERGRPDEWRISVIIPTRDRPEELRLCLEGFAGQTVPREQFEVIVVDDGSATDITPVVSAFAPRINLTVERRAHAGAAAAKNAGIERARAPLLVLYDDDLKPLPDLLAYCLQFHQRHPGEADVALLYFVADPSIAGAPAVRWAFDRMYAFPRGMGCYDWRAFWGGAVTCKGRLFRHGLHNPDYRSVEDAELGFRLSRLVDLRVYFEPRAMGTMVRRISFGQVFGRQYARSYFHYALSRDHPAAWDFTHAPYDRPEEYLIRDPETLRTLLASAGGLERTLTPEDLDADSARFRLVCALWSRAELHAMASGWLDARAGRALHPPEITSGPLVAPPRRPETVDFAEDSKR